MKVRYYLVCALALLSAAALTGISHLVSETAEAVEITESAQLGDPAVAAELALQARFDENRRLNWETSLVPGQAPTTQFHLQKSSAYSHDPSPFRAQCYLSSYFNSGEMGGPLEISEWNWGPVAPLFQEIADRTQPGTTHTEVVLLEDYFDYYPIGFYVDTDTWNSHMIRHLLADEHLSPAGEAHYQDILDFLDQLQDTFRFPVPEGMQVTFQVSKINDGSIYALNSVEGAPVVPVRDQAYDPTQGDQAVPETDVDQFLRTFCHSITAGQNLYFLPELRLGEEDSLLDYSLTPGYGLYRLDLSGDVPTTKDLSLICPLQENDLIASLTLDDSGKRVLLTTQTGKETTLHVLDSATGELRQSFPIGTQSEQDWVYTVSDGPILMAIQVREELSSFRLYIQDQQGDYQFQYTGDFPQSFPFYWSSGVTLAFDGQRLAAVATAHSSREEPQCSFSLLVWDRDSLLYTGNYDASLNRSPRGVTQFHSINPSRVEPFSLKFT